MITSVIAAEHDSGVEPRAATKSSQCFKQA